MYLGSFISSALSHVGITEDRVSSWIGAPCGCKERVEKLDQLHAWASRIMVGKLENAKRYLEELIS